jgi:hypothetical protein
MDRYAVFRLGSRFYRLDGLHADERRAAEVYNGLVTRSAAVQARVDDGGAVTVLAAGGLDPAVVARDLFFIEAVRRALG